ncbi:ANGP4-like protein, partial [Mya arenaria]
MLFVILTSYTVLFNRCANTNELLMQTASKVLSLDNEFGKLDTEFRKSLTSLDERMDNLEIKLENSLTDLQTQLAEGLKRIAETQKNCEPKLGEITKNIPSTISNTVTQMVKSQYIAINTAMKREKVALLSLKTEMKNHMKKIDDEFENAQSSLDERLANQTKALDIKFERQSESYKSSCDSIKSDVSSLTSQVYTIEKMLPAFADCSEIRQNLGRVPSGVYHITTWKTNQTAPVFCDMDTEQGGWTVFQHRVDGSVDFYRNFSSYENGFGSLQGEFWLGLKMMHEMTSRTTHDLRIDITHADDSPAYVVYAGFSVGAGSDYTLHIGDSRTEMGLRPSGYETFNTYAKGSAFSTFDHENDSWGSYCAVYHHGAWWYRGCTYMANLNGLYYTPGMHVGNRTAMIFDSKESLKTSRMMFRPS